jgi:hypothetical protein
MSLDTIAMIGYEQGEFREAPEDWFSGTDLLVRGTEGTDNWIRGRYYDEVIKQITGYTLYHQLKNGTVQDISRLLNEYTFAHVSSVANRRVQISNEELQQLNKWFKIAAEKGCFLEAWY